MNESKKKSKLPSNSIKFDIMKVRATVLELLEIIEQPQLFHRGQFVKDKIERYFDNNIEFIIQLYHVFARKVRQYDIKNYGKKNVEVDFSAFIIFYFLSPKYALLMLKTYFLKYTSRAIDIEVIVLVYIEVLPISKEWETKFLYKDRGIFPQVTKKALIK